VIWRDLSVGRIMLAPGLPPLVPQWRWTCNFYLHCARSIFCAIQRYSLPRAFTGRS
jgi:hypothetical protein